MSRNINILLRILAAVTLAAAVYSATASSGTLLLDAKLDVEQGDLSGATVTVCKDRAPVQEITKGLRRFILELELGHTYLLSFAKPGCVTKELLLVANTPDDLAGSDFGFYFQLTLYAGTGAQAYDAPVAVIHYDPEERAFTFDRTYAKPRLVPATELNDGPRTHARKQVRPFEDPTRTLAAWVEEKRIAQ